MKKRNLTAVTLLTASVMLLSACGSSGDAATSTPSETAGNAATPTQTVLSEETPMLNETGYPIVNEPLTMRVAVNPKSDNINSYDSMPYWQDLQEKSGITLDFQVLDTDEKMNLSMASGDFPDFYCGDAFISDAQILQYSQNGVFIVLNELVDKYAVSFNALCETNPSYRAAVTLPDGNIYSLPKIDETQAPSWDTLMINAKWLEKVDKGIPTTVAEFEDVLRAFKAAGDLNENGVDDEIPYGFMWNDGAGTRTPNSMFGIFGMVDTVKHLNLKDGNVVYTVMEPEYIEGLKWFNTLYQEGLIDQECATFSREVFESRAKSTTPIYGVINGWSPLWLANGDADTLEEMGYVAIEPLIGTNGQQLWSQYASGLKNKGGFVITKECEYPEAAMRFADLMMSEEFSIIAGFGYEEEHYSVDASGNITYIDPPEGVSRTEWGAVASPWDNAFSMKILDITSRFPASASDAEKTALNAMYGEHFGEYLPISLIMVSPDDNERANTLQTELDAYVKPTIATWLMTGGIDEGYDAFVNQLNKMNVSEYIAIYQEAYDNYQLNVN